MIAAPPTLFRGSLDDPSPITDLEYETSFFLRYLGGIIIVPELVIVTILRLILIQNQRFGV